MPELSTAEENYLLNRLASTANRNKVIEETCLQYGWHWQEAEAVIDHLTQAHHLDLTRRQSPALFLGALSIFSGGVCLVAWNFLGLFNYLRPYFDPHTPDELGLYWFYSDLFQGLLFAPEALPLFISGLAMIVGSYLGMKDLWASFFNLFETDQHPSLPELLQNLQTAFQLQAETQPQTLPDFIPNEDQLAYLLKRLPEERRSAQLVEELWLKFGLPQPQGEHFVRLVLEARGQSPATRFSLPVALASLAASVTGLIWISQYLLLIGRELAAQPRLIENQWHFILRLADLAETVERYPAGLLWFTLGLLLLAVGGYGLKDTWLASLSKPKWRN